MRRHAVVIGCAALLAFASTGSLFAQPAAPLPDGGHLQNPAASWLGGVATETAPAGDAFNVQTVSMQEPAAEPQAAEEAPLAVIDSPSDVAPPTVSSAAARRAPKTTPKPYKGVYYNNDFSYLSAPGACPTRLGDRLKQMKLGACKQINIDVGGEYRLRQEDQHILGRNDNFILHRTRVYADVNAGGWLRGYAEGIDAMSNWEDLPTRPIDENRFDALNLFGDIRVFDGCRGDLWIRGGRQELLYGAERLVSPLDWANTRRTFDGVNVMWHGAKWDADAFWTRPVPLGQHAGGDKNFDAPDQSQEFSGIYLTRKGLKNQAFNAYFLRYLELDGATNFEYNTVGSRWEGSLKGWLLEAEGAYQWGDYGRTDHDAWFYTLGVGRKFGCLPWKPVLWAYYDWASGDRDPTDGRNETFNQLFPLGHKYFGFMDIVARQNIEDLNFRLVLSPREKVQLMVWWHIFQLQQARDSLYNAGGGVVATDATGAAGQDVGQELDLVVKFGMTPRADLLFGYSHLFAGDFVTTTTGFTTSDFFYSQLSVRF